MCFLITSFHSQEIFNIGCHHTKSDSTVVLDKKLTSPRSLYASGYIKDSMILYPNLTGIIECIYILKMSVDFFQNMSCLCSHIGLGWVGLYHSIPLTGYFLSQCIRKREQTAATMKCSSLEGQVRLSLLTIFSRDWFHSLA